MSLHLPVVNLQRNCVILVPLSNASIEPYLKPDAEETGYQSVVHIASGTRQLTYQCYASVQDINLYLLTGIPPESIVQKFPELYTADILQDYVGSM